jgi:hypothetical protein
LSEKKTVTDLQAKLIEKCDEELVLLKSAVENEVKSVQGVVETELRKYSSASTKTWTAALAAQKMRAAVKLVADKEDRRRININYHDIRTREEFSGEDLHDKVSRVLAEVEVKPVIRYRCRAGFKKENRKQSIKFSLSISDMVNQIMRKAILLRRKEIYCHIHISFKS